jgi:hypothetical protein
MPDPNHGKFSIVYPDLSVKEKRADLTSVARVRPRTSKGITDLLLPLVVWLRATYPTRKFN